MTDQGQFGQNLCFSAAQIPDEEKSINMTRVMLQLGVDIHQKDNLKQTPLYYSARDGKIKLIQFHLAQGLMVNEVDTYGQNAIYYAVNLGKLEACKLMKAYGSDHDMVDENG